ncbi:MAG: NAD(P)/FAD-dependent oxidoreductase [Pseudomonadota bacterium]
MTDLTGQVSDWIDRLEGALAQPTEADIAALFHPDAIWRDLVALTWNIHPSEGTAAILKMLTENAEGLRDFQLIGEARSVEDWIEAEFKFATRAVRGRGHVRLKNGRAWTLLTSAEELLERPWAEGRQREIGTHHGRQPGRIGWGEARAAEAAQLGADEDPDVVIIGGGQGGMALGARLKSLGVSNVILEKRARAGDSWRDRYESLCLHDPVWYDHMPYIPFPAGWPVFTPKDRMADWLEMYARVMALEYWAGSTALRATRDGARWEVTVDRQGERLTLRPRHLVFATGMSGYARVPEFDGADDFAGQQIHSSEYRTGRDHQGATAVVIGANTSAHDICHDLWEHGVPVTMIQRSSTLVARSDNVVQNLLAPLYSEDALAAGITTERADFLATTWPWALMADRIKPLAKRMAEQDSDLHARLRAVGFMLDNGEDGAGIPLKSARRGGGFYIDVGASGLIADGEVSLISGQQVARLDPDGVVLEDGQKLPCDLVIYATGYGSMNQFVGDLCGQEMADQIGRVWGLGSGLDTDPGPWQGELRNMWKPTSVDGLLFQGGNLAQSRHYSRFLAMQIKARLSGIETPVYAPAPASPGG